MRYPSGNFTLKYLSAFLGYNTHTVNIFWPTLNAKYLIKSAIVFFLIIIVMVT